MDYLKRREERMRDTNGQPPLHLITQVNYVTDSLCLCLLGGRRIDQRKSSELCAVHDVCLDRFGRMAGKFYL
jgi:hypothetical protein